MSDDQQPVVAEITREAHARCLAIGHGTLDAVEALTVTYVYDAPPPEPGLIRIALVSPVRFADGATEF